MFKAKDYILNPKDIFEMGKRLWQKSDLADRLGALNLILYALVFGRLFGIALEPLFFIGFIYAIIYFKMDSRVSIALALAGLVIIPILLELNYKNILFLGDIWAERVAVWAYYFLVIGVVKQIFEYRQENKKV